MAVASDNNCGQRKGKESHIYSKDFGFSHQVSWRGIERIPFSISDTARFAEVLPLLTLSVSFGDLADQERCLFFFAVESQAISLFQIPSVFFRCQATRSLQRGGQFFLLLQEP